MKKTMTMTNAEWFVKNKYDFDSIYLVDNHDGSFNIMYKNCSNCIGKAFSITSAGALIRWLSAKHVDPILDDAEKSYLSTLIRPFRNEIKAITKDNYLAHKLERIYFYTKAGELFYLKSFKAGTMYKGMEAKKRYTLKDLGL